MKSYSDSDFYQPTTTSIEQARLVLRRKMTIAEYTTYLNSSNYILDSLGATDLSKEQRRQLRDEYFRRLKAESPEENPL